MKPIEPTLRAASGRRCQRPLAARDRIASAIAATFWVFACGCSPSDEVKIALHARPASSEFSSKLKVEAQVTGPQDGLRYRWYSVYGELDPQETLQPETVYRFAEGVFKDRVTVEVERHGLPVARRDIDVSYKEPAMALVGGNATSLRVEVTLVPPLEVGGPDTRAEIAGKVIGQLEAERFVVVYARAYDYWWIQPTASARLPIADDGSWSTWTHTGASYAALVVLPDFAPVMRMDLLPPVGGNVLARAIVEGRRDPQQAQ